MHSSGTESCSILLSCFHVRAFCDAVYMPDGVHSAAFSSFLGTVLRSENIVKIVSSILSTDECTVENNINGSLYCTWCEFVTHVLGSQPELCPIFVLQ